jgi:TonB-linked SusC/RagA family outer membrane protein
MKQLLTILGLVCAMATAAVAQRTVTGKVTGDDGEGLIGATITVKGTNAGARTDASGMYSVAIPADVAAPILVFSYTGYTTQEIPLGASNAVDVTLAEGLQLDETVVTALGVTRYKNELPYSAQKVDGSDVSNTRDANVVNALSGKVAGLNVKRNNNLGGSTNIVLRGNRSLTGDNQALFVIDGVPVDNSNTNTLNQRTARLGYDYGNAANDINADDIESITVLKGAAASALYGSRAANGVVMIQTKKGSKDRGIGVSVNTGMNWGTYDPSTFIKYQQKYGGGYGAYYEDESGFFLSRDVNGDGEDDLVMPTSEDASWGGKFDPNLLVYQWDAFDPKSPFYGKAKPWVAAANGPASFFETAVGSNHNVTIDGSSDRGYFKLGYTKADDKGILPNSKIRKDLVNFGASYNIAKNLTASSSINFTSTDGLGRYGNGYDSKNQMTSFREWWQVNVDVQEQKDAYFRDLKNITWNWADPTALVPIYWDNPYWVRYENYQNDHRNRYFGNVGLTYNITSWLDLTGRVSLDQYDEMQEERIAVGSIDVSEYQRFNRNFRELNYDLLAQVKPLDLTSKLSFNALVGGNIRQQHISSIRSKTNGGLSLHRVYSLANSKSSLLAPVEAETDLEVDGVFAQAGFVFDHSIILDLSMRRDQASSLPAGNNIYYYPSASLGLVFSQWLPQSRAFSFGKLRLNYAEVGNTALPLSVLQTYRLSDVFGDASLASVSDASQEFVFTAVYNNPDLKPERTQSLEGGLEMRFLDSRLGFDVSVYKTNTLNQILPAPVTRSTGYTAKVINAGEIENRGVEVSLFLRPVASRNFDWRIDLNWARNRSEVVNLGGEIDNLLLASMQGGVSVNATVGEPYGTIRGSNFVYMNGQKVVNAAGYYKTSATSNEVIGNVNPDWTGGVFNSFRYRWINFSFLIDMRQGGQLFSLDRYYGLATGMPEETAGLNDLGNEVRAPLGEGGGLILPGVKEDGSPNDIRYDATNFGIYGYRRNPAAGFIYDASFVKLREVNLGVNLPTSWWSGSVNAIKGIGIGVYGRNLWIIDKNLPDADPEDGMSSGNIQGYQVGSYPTVRTIGVNLNVKF